jgi:hypothetical protein
MTAVDDPYRPPVEESGALRRVPLPEEDPIATFESTNPNAKLEQRWKVRFYPDGLHLAPGLGDEGYWVSRRQFLEQGEILLGAGIVIQVQLDKKVSIPLHVGARRVLRAWLDPDEGRLVARSIKRFRLWLVLVGGLWVWGALPTATHGLVPLDLLAGGVALVTALVGFLRPHRLVLLGESLFVVIWMITLALQLFAGKGSAWSIAFLVLGIPWLAGTVARYRFYGPLPPPADP